MKDGHYIGLHTQAKYWLPRDRKYTELEAIISHTLDLNDNQSWTISGYSKLWGWSRNRVRSFLNNIRTPIGHHKDTHQDSQRTAGGQGVVLKINNFDTKEDSKRTPNDTPTGQATIHPPDTTINNKKKNKKNNNKKHIYGKYENVLLTDKEYQQLEDRFNSHREHWIETLSEGLALKGYVYKSHYLAILKWSKKDGKNETIHDKYTGLGESINTE